MIVRKNIVINNVKYPSNGGGFITDSGNSQITEPDMLIPLLDVNDYDNSNNLGNNSSSYIPIDVLNNVNTSNTSTGSTSGTVSSGTKPNNTSEPSATTDETKTYVGGGTTPDSNIVVKKPTTKYFVYGIVGLLGALVIYKFFLNKKS
jgi:hypothetical protein